MKKTFLFFAAVLLTATLWAQSPEKISYQAVVRDNVGNLVIEQEVGLRISILQYSETGTEVYKEIYNPNPMTNINGLLSLEIGGGVVITGNFAEIDWSDGPYFLKTEIDPTGGTNYTIIGTNQLLSVPYALHAKTAQTVVEEVEYTEIDPTVPQYVKDIESVDIDNWNEAYGWGDHSDQDYFIGVPEETDPTVPTHVKSITEGDISSWNSKYEAGDVIDVLSVQICGLTVIDISGNLVGPAALHYHDASSIATGVFDISRIPVGTTASTVAAGNHHHVASDITAGVFPIARGGTGAVTAAAARSNLGAAASLHTHSLASVLQENNDAEENQIKNLADPTDAQDAATKAYVDETTPATYEIGDLAHGGIVFYVEPCGIKGLVAAAEDQSDGIKWRGGSTNYVTMARGHEVYAGKMNTSIIIAVHTASGDADDHAALICANYTGGDFGDWYLPSREELLLMYNNLHNQGLGDFTNGWYWSSSEVNADYLSWGVGFDVGHAFTSDKDGTGRVRAVRAF